MRFSVSCNNGTGKLTSPDHRNPASAVRPPPYPTLQTHSSWCPQPGRHLPRCLFSQEANSNPTLAKTPLKKPWHGLLRALVQEWTDLNCKITSANNFSGLQAGMSPISPAQLAGSVRKFNLNRPFILPMLSSHPSPSSLESSCTGLHHLVGATGWIGLGRQVLSNQDSSGP